MSRIYYIARTRVPMIRLCAQRLTVWFVYDLAAGVHSLVRMLLFEDRRRRKLAALALGTRDALRRRMGKASPYSVLLDLA